VEAPIATDSPGLRPVTSIPKNGSLLRDVSQGPRVYEACQRLSTLGIRVLRGRGINERDVAASPWVAVVNKTFADRHFPNQDPLGKAIRVSMGDQGESPIVQEPQQREIVGVVADVAYPSFFRETPAAVYVPFRQHLWQYAREEEWIHTQKTLAVRTAVDPQALMPAIKDAVAQVDRDQTPHDLLTMEQRVARSPSVTNSRFFATLFSIFGTLAILLAMLFLFDGMTLLANINIGIRHILPMFPFLAVIAASGMLWLARLGGRL
jgi:hypothetical protein